MRLYVAVGFILLLAGVFAASSALLAQDSPPIILLVASGPIQVVGETETVTWTVSEADSVSVKRNGVEVSTDHQGEWEETLESEGEIIWEVYADNRKHGFAKSVNILVVPVEVRKELQAQRSHYVAGRHNRITSGPVGEGALQVIISVIPGMVFIVGSILLTKNVTPGPFIAAGIVAPVVAFLLAAVGLGNYWMAAAMLILLPLSILGWVGMRKGRLINFRSRG